MILIRIHIYQTNTERTFIRRFGMYAELVCQKLSSIHTFWVRENKSSHGHWCWTNILWRSFNYRHPRERYQLRMKAFAITRSLLLYHPYIYIHYRQTNAFACHSFGICVRDFTYIRHSLHYAKGSTVVRLVVCSRGCTNINVHCLTFPHSFPCFCISFCTSKFSLAWLLLHPVLWANFGL